MRLLFRADAGVNIGTGHVMRCLALAEAAVERGFPSVFAMSETTSAISARITEAGLSQIAVKAVPGSLEDAQITSRLVIENSSEWVVADGYHFGGPWQCAVKDTACPLLLFDDVGSSTSYSADLVLNQNLHADPSLYPSRSPETSLLLGLQYLIVRSEFRIGQAERIHPPWAQRILVSMGGSDPSGATEKVVDGLSQVPAVEVRVVVGGSNPRKDELRDQIRRHGERFSCIVDARNLAEHIRWADLGVLACGSTVWEAGCLGLPILVVVCADNQSPTAEGLTRMGAAVSLGRAMDLDVHAIRTHVFDLAAHAQRRKNMTDTLSPLINPLGVYNVLDAMAALNRN